MLAGLSGLTCVCNAVWTSGTALLDQQTGVIRDPGRGPADQVSDSAESWVRQTTVGFNLSEDEGTDHQDSPIVVPTFMVNKRVCASNKNAN